MSIKNLCLFRIERFYICFFLSFFILFKIDREEMEVGFRERGGGGFVLFFFCKVYGNFF